MELSVTQYMYWIKTAQPLTPPFGDRLPATCKRRRSHGRALSETVVVTQRSSSLAFLALLISPNGVLHAQPSTSLDESEWLRVRLSCGSEPAVCPRIGSLHFPFCRSMAPKFSISHSSSILVENVGQDDFDLGDCWGGRDTYVAPRWRISCPDKKPATWGSRLTSLSSNLRGARTVLTTRAKQLGVGKSTRRVITQLRSSMVDASSPVQSPLPRATSMPSDIDPFGDVDDQPESEDESCDDRSDKRSRLHASQSWTQGS